MKITLENTDQTLEVNGLPARLWQGTTESGIEVHAIIFRIAVHHDADARQFEKELVEVQPLARDLWGAYPSRLLIPTNDI